MATLAAFGLVGCSAAYQPTPEQVAAKLADVDFGPYDKDEWPSVFAMFPSNPERVTVDLVELRKKGAKAAAEREACDRVAWSEYSPEGSTSGNLRVYVDCVSGFRLYLDERGAISTEQNRRLD